MNQELEEMRAIEHAIWIWSRKRRDQKIAASPIGLAAVVAALDGESLPVDNCFSAWAAAHAEEHALCDAVRRAFLGRREEISRAADAAFRAKNQNQK